ncbi:hypothetical protein K227x_59130 [Rubripirellula lacrimiformis]|uniref:Uncharacterized protein n=1 Tax=Rubripirellula lacrimiformis TaxID=1930273 RepID=A0A517NK30_9BACT|nr:hypothetical protein [Rubripirellula lacrimiformis]QDT07486.1 hypothetical protein K227x_59130 [Rubripirellula lacrimiformis]
MRICHDSHRYDTRPGAFPTRKRWMFLLLICILVFAPWALILVFLIAWLLAEIFLTWLAIRQLVCIKN